MNRLFVLIGFTLASSVAFAKSAKEEFVDIGFENTIASQVAKCKVGDRELEIAMNYHKAMGPEDEDFGPTMVFVKGKSTTTVEKLRTPYEKNYKFVKPKEGSVCDNTQGSAIGKDHVAILYNEDNRPFHDLTHVLVWDLKKDRLVENKIVGAVSKSGTTKAGLWFTTVVPRSDADMREFELPSKMTVQVIDTTDLEAIQVVSLANGKVRIESDPIRTYDEGRWKKYFKTRQAFLKAAGWNAKKKAFSNIVPYRGKTEPADPKLTPVEDCVVFVASREVVFKSTDFTCITEAQ